MIIMRTYLKTRIYSLYTKEPGASELIQCDKCEKQFSRRYMKMHRQIHDEERPVLHCPKYLCPRYFYFLRNLKQHINSFHLGAKFQCTFRLFASLLIQYMTMIFIVPQVSNLTQCNHLHIQVSVFYYSRYIIPFQCTLLAGMYFNLVCTVLKTLE